MRKLEFPNKLARSTSKIPGHTSMTWSFYIWLARNTRSWEVEHTSLPTKPSPTNQAPFQNSQTFSGTSQKKLSKEDSIGAASKRSIFNKGIICCANSILWALSVLPNFYSLESSEHDKILPLFRAVNLNKPLLKRKTSPNYCSTFLWAVRNKITKDRRSSFKFNSQQDVPEILQIVIDELKGIYQVADNIISSTLQTSVTCNVCLGFNIQEEKIDIITLPLTSSVPESFKKVWSLKNWQVPTDGFARLAMISQTAQRKLNS